jgi:hypothetical protein
MDSDGCSLAYLISLRQSWLTGTQRPTSKSRRDYVKAIHYHLSFLLLAVEGLKGLVHRAVELGLYKGFRINDDLQFNIMQFADDTILVGEGIWENIWCIKSILQSFKFVSGLKLVELVWNLSVCSS